MTALTWDGTGEKRFENGVDHGVLYLLNTVNGLYDTGVAWNGLTSVNEKPGGAAANKQFADNIAYLNLLSAETFAGTIQALTFPSEFEACDGIDAPAPGVSVGQQDRATFGMCYRTIVGNDIDSNLGYKLHLMYGALATPSEKDFATVNDSPAAVAFSWDVNCTPVPFSAGKPTCLMVIDSTEVDSAALTALQDLLYGTGGSDPSLPLPDSVAALFTGAITHITLTAPTFDGAHTITIPSQTGVTYRVDGVVHAAGTQLLTTGQKKIVTATPNAGYVFNQPFVDRFMFTFVS